MLRTYYKRRRIVVVREGVLVATGCSFLATGLCKLGFRLAHHDGEDRRSRKRQGQAGEGTRREGEWYANHGRWPYKYLVMGVYASVSLIHNIISYFICSDTHSDLSEHTSYAIPGHHPPTSPSYIPYS